MPDETTALRDRATTLADKLENERKKYWKDARLNYAAVQVISLASAAAGICAALLGLIPILHIPSWQVGLVAAISPALIAASRQLGFQQKANWHYRKVDRITTLQKRLAYELPVPPSLADLAAISQAWSTLDTDMSKEWENMQQEPTATPGRANTSTPDRQQR